VNKRELVHGKLYNGGNIRDLSTLITIHQFFSIHSSNFGTQNCIGNLFVGIKNMDGDIKKMHLQWMNIKIDLYNIICKDIYK